MLICREADVGNCRCADVLALGSIDQTGALTDSGDPAAARRTSHVRPDTAVAAVRSGLTGGRTCFTLAGSRAQSPQLELDEAYELDSLTLL
jgi:hypothetical protein